MSESKVDDNLAFTEPGLRGTMTEDLEGDAKAKGIRPHEPARTAAKITIPCEPLFLGASEKTGNNLDVQVRDDEGKMD